MHPERVHRWPLPASKLAATLCIAALSVLPACGRTLVATPNLYLDPAESPYAAVPDAARTPAAEIIYVTDRLPENPGTPDDPAYGHDRSQTLGFGLVTVNIGDPAAEWEDLVRDSTTRKRADDWKIEVAKVRELGRFADITLGLTVTPDGQLAADPQRLADVHAAEADLAALIAERAAALDTSDAFVFIHGYNNEFDDAAAVTAELWHFFGRRIVPIAYTWPAGSGGLRGYAYDRESGEFTIFHLQQLLRTLANTPGIDRLHLISHSRGTDVLLTALREIHIHLAASGRSTREVLGLETIVFAAPDLSLDVIRQRFAPGGLPNAAGRTVVYVSPKDSAIGLAQFLFGGERVGRMRSRDVQRENLDAFRTFHRLEIIDCQISGFSSSHNYFYAHPAALSDLILVIRDRAPAGPVQSRPLEPDGAMWVLRNDYPDPHHGPARVQPASHTPIPQNDTK